MPPEPLPWDRRDFLKERKRERSSESIGSVSRWRENPHHGSSSREFFRSRPPGHGKQGGWHNYSQESGHGFTPNRSNEKILGDESFRPSGSRTDGKWSRNSRENRGSFSHKDWRGHSSENGSSPNGPGRPSSVSDQRSVDDMLPYNYHRHSDFVNTCEQIHSNGQHNKTDSVNGLGTGQRLEGESSLGSIDWKPLKWTRSGSLSSRGSGFSHSSSSKSMGVDSSEAKAELQPRNGTPLQSPSGDCFACATLSAPSEETNPRKKPRLGWGEGLAKYEKKKVEGPDDSATKNGMVVCVNGERLHSHVLVQPDKSPRFTGLSDCGSPGTPSSVACSSSSGMGDKPPVKAANIGNDTSKLSASPSLLPQAHVEGTAFNLENLELIPIANLRSALDELLKSDNTGSVDSCFERSTGMNKLLVGKGDVLKALEMTESEIDLLENELKLLTSESRNSWPCLARSSSLQRQCQEKHCEEPVVNSGVVLRPAPPQFVSSGDTIEKKVVDNLGEECGQLEDKGMDSPGTVTSKFFEPRPSVNAAALSEFIKHGGSNCDLDASKSSNQEVTCSVYVSNGVKAESLPDFESGGQLIASKNCAAPVGASLHGDRKDTSYDLILASNKDSASRASVVFNKLLPSDRCHTDILRAPGVSSWQNDPLIQQKFAVRKQFLRFKERVITLKFRAFLHLWKEDMRLLSIRKHLAKSQKRLELSSRAPHNGYQKHRSSLRSRFSSHAGNLSLVPKAEIIHSTSKLLSDSQVKLYRNSLKMPALILDKKEIMISRFISSNGLVEDPCAVEKERVMINCWSTEEKEIFMDKLATFGKDFAKIASFLDHKTTADCVEFYYRNHKSDWFVKIKKKPEFANQVKFSSTNNYLVTSAKRWTREMNAASLDMLGAAILANAADGRQNQQKCKKRFPMGVTTGYRARRGDVGIVRRSASLERERETVAADVLAGICGSLSSEAMSSSTRWHLTPEVAQNVDDETCSDERSREMNPTNWTDEEKSIFIQAVSSYGKDFTMISRCMRTRSRDECKVFFSKARKCLGLDEIHPRPGNEDMPASDNVNGGGGDNEDACVVETGSVICSESEISGSKIDEDTRQSHLNMNRIESDSAENNGTGGSFSKDPDLQSENMVTDDWADGNLEAHFDGDNKMENGIDSLTVTVWTHEDAVLPSDIETGGDEANIEGSSFAKPLLAKEANHHGQSVSGAEGEMVVVGPELVGKQLTSENNLNDEQEENVDAGKSASDLNSVDELHTNRNTSNLSAVANTLEEFGGDPKQESSISLELNPCAEPHVISAEQNVPLVNANFVTSSSQHEKTLSPDTPSTLDWEKINDNPCQKSSSADYHNPDQSGHNVFGRASSCQILRGYPLRFLTKKEVNGDISYEKLASLQSPSKECFLRKCSSSQTESSVAELLFPTQEQKSDHSRPPSRSLSDTKKPCRKHDLKLFGKILTYPTSQQNQNTSVDHENEDKGIEVQNLKLSSRSFNLEFNGTHCVDGNLIPAKLDCVDYLGLENVPMRSYGFWDGTRIRTGFSSLPDSAILLAKYPAAFGNYSTNSNMDQKFECNLNGVSVFSSREKPISNGVADYQFYRNREGSKLQPFTVDLKQRQEMNGFESVSSIQQAKGMVGINVVGRGGILVGGACTAGVSDPVTAIKMHYAKAEQYGSGQATREEES